MQLGIILQKRDTFTSQVISQKHYKTAAEILHPIPATTMAFPMLETFLRSNEVYIYINILSRLYNLFLFHPLIYRIQSYVKYHLLMYRYFREPLLLVGRSMQPEQIKNAETNTWRFHQKPHHYSIVYRRNISSS